MIKTFWKIYQYESTPCLASGNLLADIAIAHVQPRGSIVTSMRMTSAAVERPRPSHVKVVAWGPTPSPEDEDASHAGKAKSAPCDGVLPMLFELIKFHLN
jgi:hypothetical protein